jgi:hypothetical protein
MSNRKGKLRFAITWPVVILLVWSETLLVGVWAFGVYAKLWDADSIKYVVSFVVGSFLTAPIPLARLYREKKPLTEGSDPPSGDP